MSTTRDWSPSHRQLLSAVISLVLPDSSGRVPQLNSLGYELSSIELLMTDRTGRPYRLDLHLLKNSLNLSLEVDCKTWHGLLKQEQIDKYLDTTPANVVAQSGIVLNAPRGHNVDVVFIFLPDVETTLAQMIANCPTRSISGLGLVRVDPTKWISTHDELTDPDLSNLLSTGLDVEISRMPLERLPYEADAPRWELANSILQTIQEFYIKEIREFDVATLCASSNPLWEFMAPSQSHLLSRVRDEVRTLRRTALRNWLQVVSTGTGKEERWQFSKPASSRANVLGGYARRHRRYVEVLRDDKRSPSPGDFVNIDPEQLVLF